MSNLGFLMRRAFVLRCSLLPLIEFQNHLISIELHQLNQEAILVQSILLILYHFLRVLKLLRKYHL